MNPYKYIRESTKNGETLLDLCCGIGLGLEGVEATEVTAVDIHQAYLDKVHERCPKAKLVCSDALSYVQKAEDKSIDVVALIDCVEHMTKEVGLSVIRHAKRIARKEVLLFTPEGYLKNEPHNAWGVEGGDEYQKHLSGWEVKEIEFEGFKLVERADDQDSQHGEKYNALMFRWWRDV